MLRLNFSIYWVFYGGAPQHSGQSIGFRLMRSAVKISAGGKIFSYSNPNFHDATYIKKKKYIDIYILGLLEYIYGYYGCYSSSE